MDGSWVCGPGTVLVSTPLDRRENENGRPWAAVDEVCSIEVRRQAGHQQDFWHISTRRGYR